MEATHRVTSVNCGLLAPVVEWARAREKRGDIPQITARLWLTALDQFLEILDADDPTDPKLFFDQLDRLTDRYCVKKLAKGETAKSYKSRVRSLLTNYFAWDKQQVIERLTREQGEACAVCLETVPLVLDHDHATGDPRAMLCRRCNAGFGLMRECPSKIRGLLAYAERYRVMAPPPH